MSANNRVVWNEGLFLRPEHFQQQERFFERYVDLRVGALNADDWGFEELEIERDWLAVGKFALRRAKGVLADGTPFSMPDDDALPPALEIPEKARSQMLVLVLPLRTAGRVDFERQDGVVSAARYAVRDWETRDTTAIKESPALMEVAGVRARLMLEADAPADASRIPVAWLIERRADGQVLLDENFIPTVLQCRSAPRLSAFLSELHGLLRQRSEALAARAAASGRGGAAEIVDYLMLQAVNRYEPVLAHLAFAGRLHPEALFRQCLAVAGELATYTAASKRPDVFPPYRHERLRESFDPVFQSLRQALSAVIDQTALQIPLDNRKSVRVGIVHDKAMLDTAQFVLAVFADMPVEELRRRFPAQLKMGPVEKIRDLVTRNLPGITIQPLPVAPRQLPYHAGYQYYEIDRASALWRELKTSGGLAIYPGGEFPGLGIELWAIRG